MTMMNWSPNRLSHTTQNIPPTQHGRANWQPVSISLPRPRHSRVWVLMFRRSRLINVRTEAAATIRNWWPSRPNSLRQAVRSIRHGRMGRSTSPTSSLLLTRS